MAVVAFLSGIDLTAFVVLIVFLLVLIFTGHAVRLSWRDVKTTVERVAQTTDQVNESLGVPNGNGDVTNMLAKVMGTQAEMVSTQAEMMAWMDDHSATDLEQFENLREHVRVIDDLLAKRTPLLQTMRAELDELNAYSHQRFHDVLNAMTVATGRVEVMWRDYLHRQHNDTTEDP